MSLTNEQLASVGIDVEPTLERFQNNTDFLAQKLGMFVGTNGVVRMQAALDSGDAGKIQRAFTSTKNLAAEVGLTSIVKDCDAVLKTLESNHTKYIQELGALAIAKCLTTYSKIRHLA